MFEFEIFLASGHVVVGKDEAVEVGGAERQPDAAYADALLWVEELLQQRLAGLGRHLHQVFGTAAREGVAEAVDSLVALPGVDYDVVSVFLPLGRKFGGMLLLGEKFRPVRACDVRADGLCRGRDGKSGGEGQGQEFF